MPQGPAARLGDPVTPPHVPPVLTGGPPATTVLIGMMPAWKGIPLAAGPAIAATNAATESMLQTLETAAKIAEAAAIAGAGTPAAPGLVATATAARLAAETAKATAAATNAASIAAAAATGASMHACALPWPIPPHGPGVVIDGSPTVLIENAPACRMGDTIIEAIGPPNKIMMGCPTVIIGNSGGGGGAGGAGGAAGAGAGAGAAGAGAGKGGGAGDDEFKKLLENIKIEGDEDFKKKVLADLKAIYDTPTGKKLLQSIADSGKTVTIKKTAGGNSEDATNFDDGLLKADGTKGPGSDSTVSFNPDKKTIGDGSEDWMTRPTSVGLAHELIHAAHDANGTTEYDYSNPGKKPQNYEKQAVGLDDTKNGKNVDYSGNDYTENKIREDMGEPKRTHY